ncbi:transcription initiation factor TFIID subunit 9B-like [Ptychodera flava]|uniref:transcription initiation factor TFIID subunit 9B-like n=1 Tax=Ptychodera flava TaxID=63121 RepID=UPI003969BB80
MAAPTNTATATPQPAKSSPRDAQVMAAILKDMGITDYEPRVINQMLEFTYRYVTNILDDAKVYSQHSGKKSVDADDVKLSIQHQMDRSFTTPPPRDLLMEIARQKNSIPLPLIKPHNGPRLPPDRYCLSAVNYKLKNLHKKPTLTIPRINLAHGSTTLNKPIHTLSLATKPSAPISVTTPTGVTIVNKPASALSVGTTQIATQVRGTPATPNTMLQPTSVMTTPVSKATPTGTPFTVRIIPNTTTVTSPQPQSVTTTTTGVKRKREDEEEK